MIIPLKSVVANAFIELRRKNREADVLFFYQMEAYRRNLINLLIEKGEVVAIPCSGKDVSDFFNDYSELFELKDKNKEPYIYLKGNKKSIDDTLMDFNAFLPLKFLAIISNKKSALPLFK